MASAELEGLKKAGRHAWRAAWWLVAIQVAATAAGLFALKHLPKQFQTTTAIRVERSQLINPLTRGLAVSSQMEERLRGIREEILSRDYFEKIITRLALVPLDAPPLRREALMLRMMANTEIASRSRDADTFQVTYTGSDPKEVRDVTNLLAGIFIEDSLSNKANEAGAAVEFLQDQLEIYRKKLEEAEAALRKFEERNVDQLPSNRAAQLARFEQIRAMLMEVQSNLRQVKIQRDHLRLQAASSQGAPVGGDASAGAMVVNPLQTLLIEKEAALRRLLVDYSETYPDVIALRAEIAGLEEELLKSPMVPAAQALHLRQPSVQDALSLGQLQQTETQVAALTMREQQLGAELARYEKKVQSVPEVEQELARLRRDYEVNNDIYNNFLRRLEEAKVTKELEASKKGEVFRILQAASLPLNPVRPNRFQTVLAAVAAGLGLGALLVFVLMQRDTSIQTAEEAQRLLNLKVLAGIPWHEPPKVHSRQIAKAVALALVVLLYVGSVAGFLFYGHPLSSLLKTL